MKKYEIHKQDSREPGIFMPSGVSFVGHVLANSTSEAVREAHAKYPISTNMPYVYHAIMAQEPIDNDRKQ